jgi:16S rRNA processing protein RimM
VGERSAPVDPVVIGEIGRAHGVRGWVWVTSYTRPLEDIRRYRQWFVEDASKGTNGGVWYPVKAIHNQSKGLVAQLDGVTDRNAAERLTGRRVAVDAADLPPTDADEYYWRDLIGCAVVNTDGTELGTVRELIETGANDVLVVEGDRERLIPFAPGEIIVSVGVAPKQLTVDWDPAF